MSKKIIFPVLIIVGVTTVVLGLSVFNRQSLSPESPTGGSQARNLVALGSSFTKANNLSSRLKGDNPDYSFATGTKIESFYLYLKTKGENLRPINLAESGADSQKVLSQQVPNALSFQPKYITLDIMVDILEEKEPSRFRKNLTEIGKQLKSSGAVVLFSTYPNLVSMRKASLPACLEDKLGLGINKITEEQLKLFNETIKEVARDYNFILVDNFATLGPQDVSDYDCLHPNAQGQEKLAKAWIQAFKKGGEQK